MSLRAIAAQEGVHPETVREAVLRAITLYKKPPAQARIQMEEHRLDSLLESVWDWATGDVAVLLAGKLTPAKIGALLDRRLHAIEQARKILADRRRFYGVESPAEKSSETSEIDFSELKSLLRDAGYEIVPIARDTTGEEVKGELNGGK